MKNIKKLVLISVLGTTMFEQSVQAKHEPQQEAVSKVIKAHFKYLAKIKNAKDLKKFIHALRKDLTKNMPYTNSEIKEELKMLSNLENECQAFRNEELKEAVIT